MDPSDQFDRRQLLSMMGQWSGAALAVVGLGTLASGCAPQRGVMRPAPPYANYADYFDYADYVDYGNYANYADAGYADYADYANYANYGDYFDYANYVNYANYSDGTYGDYADSPYQDYANYANYGDYSDYGDYGDYGDYWDYSDYMDHTDGSATPPRKAPPRNIPVPPYTDYANYADTYCDTGREVVFGRRSSHHGPRQTGSAPPKRTDRDVLPSDLPSPPREPGPQPTEEPVGGRHRREGDPGQARQGDPNTLLRPGVQRGPSRSDQAAPRRGLRQVKGPREEQT